MHLAIIAATGGIGRQILAQARNRGHHVTAVARDTSRLPRDVMEGVAVDLAATDPTALEQAVAPADAVLSGLGPRSRSDAGITSRGTDAVIAAMQATGCRRLVTVSAAPVGTVPSPDRPTPLRHDPGDGVAMRYLASPLLKAIFREHYADLAVMEDRVRASGLDWTIVRPPRLTNGPLTGTYRTADGRNVRRGARISRADVADLMLRSVERGEAVKHTVAIAY
jgi:putative NADH-flavin reductase